MWRCVRTTAAGMHLLCKCWLCARRAPAAAARRTRHPTAVFFNTAVLWLLQVRSAFDWAYNQLTAPCEPHTSLLARILRLDPVLFLRGPPPALPGEDEREKAAKKERGSGGRRRDKVRRRAARAAARHGPRGCCRSQQLLCVFVRARVRAFLGERCMPQQQGPGVSTPALPSRSPYASPCEHFNPYVPFCLGSSSYRRASSASGASAACRLSRRVGRRRRRTPGRRRRGGRAAGAGTSGRGAVRGRRAAATRTTTTALTSSRTTGSRVALVAAPTRATSGLTDQPRAFCGCN